MKLEKCCPHNLFDKKFFSLLYRPTQSFETIICTFVTLEKDLMSRYREYQIQTLDIFKMRIYLVKDHFTQPKSLSILIN